MGMRVMGTSAILSGRSKLDSRVARVAIAFYAGIVAALVLLMVVYLPLYFTGSSGPSKSSSPKLRTFPWSSDQTEHLQIRGESRVTEAARAQEVTVLYVMDWESPDVREATEDERVGEAYGEAHRAFIPMGTGSFLFTHFGTYRTGPSSFGVVGLGPRPLHGVWNSNPGFQCSWVGPSPPSDGISLSQDNSTVNNLDLADGKMKINGTAVKYLVQDMEVPNREQHEYIAVVVHCTFDAPVGIDGRGGELNMVADHGEHRNHTGLKSVEFVAMVEDPGVYNASLFDEPFQYDYLYCGSPLYGSINPQRVREWITYHMRLFGKNSHFILYDAGGISDDVWKVLEPWVKLGRVTIMNVRQQARYNAHLYNQFLLANDCMLRAKTLAKWTFFFDLDEYIHVSKDPHLESSFHQVMDEMAKRGRRATSVQLLQRAMSSDRCVQKDSPSSEALERQWAIEKLVYRRQVENRMKYWPSHWQDVKSAVQAKYLLSMGVHTPSQVEVPEGLWKDDTTTHLAEFENCGSCLEDKMHYYHYRGVATMQGELCKVNLDPKNTTHEFDWGVYEFDNTMTNLADITRDFELHTIGPIPLDKPTQNFS